MNQQHTFTECKVFTSYIDNIFCKKHASILTFEGVVGGNNEYLDQLI